MKEGDPGVVRIIQRAQRRPDPVCTQPANTKTHRDHGIIHAPGLRDNQFAHLVMQRLVIPPVGQLPPEVGAIELTQTAAAKWATKVIRIFAKQAHTTAQDVREYSAWVCPSPQAVILLTEPYVEGSNPWETCRCKPGRFIPVHVLCQICLKPPAAV